MLSKIRTVIIIVTYNPDPDFFNQYLDFNNYQFIIVDNSDSLSANITIQLNAQPNVLLISNQQNLGIAKALNIGCQKALDLGYEYVITMDQDSIIDKNIINTLLDYYHANSSNQNIAIISPAHVVGEGVRANDKFISTQSAVNTIFTMTSGNLLILRYWQKLNGFDDRLFIDMVDLDYYTRCILNSYQVLTLPNVIMNHQLGSIQFKFLLGKRISVMNHSAIRKYYQTRNMLWFIKRYFYLYPPSRHVFRVLINMFVGVILYEQDKFNKCIHIIKGIKDFICNKYGKYQ